MRTVVLGLTAAQAAPLIGVGASTVGSYRQRAYQKLGVSTKAEFLGLSCARNGEVPLRKRRPSKWRCRRLLGSSLLSPRAGWSRLPTERFQTSWACAQMRQRPLLRARATCPSSSRLPRRRTLHGSSRRGGRRHRPSLERFLIHNLGRRLHLWLQPGRRLEGLRLDRGRRLTCTHRQIMPAHLRNHVANVICYRLSWLVRLAF